MNLLVNDIVIVETLGCCISIQHTYKKVFLGAFLQKTFTAYPLTAPSSLLLAQQSERVEMFLEVFVSPKRLDNLWPSRGDVGSWVREAAMEALVMLLGALFQRPDCHDNQDFCRSLALSAVGIMLQQSVERISRVREVSGSLVDEKKSLTLNPMPNMPHR